RQSLVGHVFNVPALQGHVENVPPQSAVPVGRTAGTIIGRRPGTLTPETLPMSVTPLRQMLRRLAAVTVPPGRSDAELLRRFLARRDEAAFAALVARHGPLVLGVCRRSLWDERDAEDAFQATFLVLARKAKSLRRPERLAAWLHSVASRVASRARA